MRNFSLSWVSFPRWRKQSFMIKVQCMHAYIHITKLFYCNRRACYVHTYNNYVYTQYIEVHHSLLIHIIVHAYGTKHVIAALVICCIHSSVLRMACASWAFSAFLHNSTEICPEQGVSSFPRTLAVIPIWEGSWPFILIQWNLPNVVTLYGRIRQVSVLLRLKNTVCKSLADYSIGVSPWSSWPS